MDVEAYLRRRYEGQIADIAIVEKEDLNLVIQIQPIDAWIIIIILPSICPCVLQWKHMVYLGNWLRPVVTAFKKGIKGNYVN